MRTGGFDGSRFPLVGFLFSLTIFGTFLTAFLFIVGSFRKELYEDRGYLTFTLPLTGNQIVGGKLIVAIMWFMVLGFVTLLYNIFLAKILFDIYLPFKEMFEMFGQFSKEAITFIIITFVGGVITLILIYFSMALSRVSIRNKKIGGLWFIIFLVLNALVAYFNVKINGLIPYYLNLSTFEVINLKGLEHLPNITMNMNGASITMGTGEGAFIGIAGMVYNLIVGIVAFLGTGYLIENKIDL
jgi:hypothetical protein